MATLNLTSEQMGMLRGASSVKELAGIARAHGMAMSHEQAVGCFNELHPSVELTDGQLNQVIGGVCVPLPPRKGSGSGVYW